MVYGEDIQESGQCVHVVAQIPVTLYTEYLKNIKYMHIQSWACNKLHTVFTHMKAGLI